MPNYFGFYGIPSGVGLGEKDVTQTALARNNWLALPSKTIALSQFMKPFPALLAFGEAHQPPRHTSILVCCRIITLITEPYPI